MPYDCRIHHTWDTADTHASEGGSQKGVFHNNRAGGATEHARCHSEEAKPRLTHKSLQHERTLIEHCLRARSCVSANLSISCVHQAHLLRSRLFSHRSVKEVALSPETGGEVFA